jgi:hypothetical protein
MQGIETDAGKAEPCVTSSESGELVLVAPLDQRRRFARVPLPRGRTAVVTRLAIGLTLGVLLGFLGLPRLELPGSATTTVNQVPTPALPQIISVQDLAASNPEPPTPQPQPTPTPGGRASSSTRR